MSPSGALSLAADVAIVCVAGGGALVMLGVTIAALYEEFWAHPRRCTTPNCQGCAAPPTPKLANPPPRAITRRR